MDSNLMLVVGVVAGFGLPWLGVALFKAATVRVEDFEAVLVTRFGKLTQTLTRPGLHVLPSRLLPHVETRRVGLQRDFRNVERIHINDVRGTSVILDLWLELRVVDPAKALFQVEDWDQSLRNVVTHAAISILGGQEFQSILADRTGLGERLRQEVHAETSRWGVEIELLFIRNVALLPEVARQMFDAVAARLQRAQADIEEQGRLQVALLEAETASQVSQLVAQAKGQYAVELGRAFAAWKDKPSVLAAYNSLHALAQLRPHRTVAFQGFGEGELRTVDAAMFQTQAPDGAGPQADAPAVASVAALS